MLNIEDSILVVIDIQEKLVLASKYGTETAQNAVKLTKTANILNIPTIVTEQYPQGLGATLLQVKETLSPETFTCEKTSFSAMLTPEFAQRIQELKAQGKKQVILCGIETHICVLQTAADLIKEGFEIYVVKDDCACLNKSENNSVLSLLNQYVEKVTCVEITLFELLKTAKHPKFKEIQALIK